MPANDGVDAEVIYGILGAAGRLNDKDAANEMLRIYNDWLKSFCSHYPDRHIGLACLPYAEPGHVANAARLLRPSGKRQRCNRIGGGRAAEQRDDIATPHHPTPETGDPRLSARSYYRPSCSAISACWQRGDKLPLL